MAQNREIPIDTIVTTYHTTTIKGKNACLVNYNNQIYYASKDGIFKLNNKTKQFSKDKSLSTIFENDEYVTGKMIVDKSNKILYISSY